MSIYAIDGTEPLAVWIPSLDTAGNGTTTLTDLVGSNDTTLTNMDAGTDWVADTGDGGVRRLDFDGSNDFCVAPVGLSITGAFTLSLWAKPAATGGLRMIAGRSMNASPWSQNYLLYMDGTQWKANVKIGGSYFTATGATVSVGTWQHVLMTHDASTLTIEVDGVAASITASGNATTSGSQRFVIGAEWVSSGAGRFYEGAVDSVWLFDSALSSGSKSKLRTSRSFLDATGAPAQNAQHNNLRNIRMAP